MCKQTLKEVVKEMCKAFPGGRSAMAGALGVSETTFNNKLYEKNGCRFFEIDELLAMEDLSNTNFFTEHCADRRNLLLVEKIKPEDLDNFELFRLQTEALSKRGELDVFLLKSLDDGVVDSKEEIKMNELFNTADSAERKYLNAFIILHKKS